MPWSVLLLGVQAIGTALMLIHLGLQRRRVHQLGRAATAVTDPSWLALLDESARILVLHRGVRLLRSRTRHDADDVRHDAPRHPAAGHR